MLDKKEVIDLIDRRIRMFHEMKKIATDGNLEASESFFNGASVAMTSIKKDIQSGTYDKEEI